MLKLNLIVFHLILLSINVVFVESQALSLDLAEIPYQIRQINLPPRQIDESKLPTTRKGNLKDAKEMFYYTDAAYCSEESIFNWECTNCRKRPDLKLNQVGVVSVEDEAWYGFLGINKGKIILSFRGTANLKNFVTGLNVLKTKFTTKDGDEMWIHSGLKDAADRLFPGVKNKLTELQAEHPDAEIFITGHSFGGALGSILAILLADEGLIEWPKTHVYTFGQTRVGDQAYADYIDSRTGATFLRVVNYLDFFSNYPNRIFGYVHNQYLLLYSDDKQIACDPYQEESRCYAFINPLEFREHSHYFGHKLSDNCQTITGPLEKLMEPLNPVLDLFKALGI